MFAKHSSKMTKRSGAKKWVALTVVVILVVGGGVYWRLKIYKPASEIVKTAGSSPSFKIKNNASSGTSSPKKQSISNNGQQITTGTDTNGKATSTTNPDQWVTSTSGAITVEQPIANATVHSGDTLSGTAKVSTVHYTLIDDSVGVISEGSLQVVNGKFSSTLDFTPHASSGQLDVYSTGSNGIELNEIQIAVNF